MGEEFRIDSAKAKRLAEELAARTGETVTQVVERALAAQLAQVAPKRQRTEEEWEQLIQDTLERGRKLRASLPPGVTSDHSDMYDEDGLPL